MARWALIRIPGEAANQALIDALKAADDEWRVAIINALGEKGNPKSVTVLAEQLNSALRAVHDAALHALARIPSKLAADTIHAAIRTYPEAAAALLEASETLADAGMMEAAEEAVARTALAGAKLTVAQQCALAHAMGRIGNDDATLLLLDELTQEDPRVRAASVEACGMLAGPNATTQIAKKMAAAASPLKTDLLRILGGRGSTMSPEAGGLIAKAAAEGDEPVRLAAIQAIEQAGIETAVPALVKGLEDKSAPVRAAAEHALNRMPGDITRQIMQAYNGKSPAIRVSLLLALGSRGDPDAVPFLVLVVPDPDPNIRVAVLQAFGRLRLPDGLGPLLAGLNEGPPFQQTAEQGLAQLEGDGVTLDMIRVYKNTPDEGRPQLLRAIGRRQHADVPPLLAAEAKSTHADIRAAAIQGLSRQDDPKLADTLLAAAKAGPVEVTRSAIDGYLRAARRVEEAPDGQRAALPMFVNALQLAVIDEQEQQAMQGIERTGDPDPAILPLLVELMKKSGDRALAASIAARAALKLPDARKDEAIPVLKQAIKLMPGGNVGQKVVERLNQLGVAVDPARDAGFITDWWLIGPFPNPGDAMFKKGYAPEQKIDLQSPLEVEGKTYRWKKHHTPQWNGVIDLEQAIAREDNVGAYAYIEITVDADQDVVVKFGSDDSAVVWINGQQVHAIQAGRPLTVDNDKFDAHLKAGVNKILVKVLNGSALWAFCMRVTQPNGEPAAFRQRVE